MSLANRNTVIVLIFIVLLFNAAAAAQLREATEPQPPGPLVCDTRLSIHLATNTIATTSNLVLLLRVENCSSNTIVLPDTDCKLCDSQLTLVDGSGVTHKVRPRQDQYTVHATWRQLVIEVGPNQTFDQLLEAKIDERLKPGQYRVRVIRGFSIRSAQGKHVCTEGPMRSNELVVQLQ